MPTFSLLNSRLAKKSFTYEAGLVSDVIAGSCLRGHLFGETSDVQGRINNQVLFSSGVDDPPEEGILVIAYPPLDKYLLYSPSSAIIDSHRKVLLVGQNFNFVPFVIAYNLVTEAI